ncbi:MAG: intradiol ring-cleavage dioxygenase [Marmoricola sp.]
MSNQHSHPQEPGELHDHDRGLSHDLPMIVRRGMGRRGLLALFGGVGAVAIAGCGTDGSTSSSGTGTSSNVGADDSPADPPGGSGAGASVAEGEIPEETGGPYPADGSNGVDVLSESGVVRSDITASFGSASGTADGVPLRIRMKVYDLEGDDATVLSGAAVYLWHCDREGRYSMYSQGAEDENYLRGVQETDAEGFVEFTSIFPAAYSGRWPHIHFEVYPSLDDATSGSGKLRTSQLALPEDVCAQVYEADGYDDSVANLSQTSLDSDNVFSDGYSLQMAKVTGSNDDGYLATLNVPV